MTDNEIIKALECCSINGCKNCKYKGKAPDCMTVLQKDTIDLINRQKAEILELQKRIINWRADMPIIRHCRNCKYRGSYFRAYDDYCKVKHKRIDKGMNLRLRALLCKHYKEKGGEEE